MREQDGVDQIEHLPQFRVTFYDLPGLIAAAQLYLHLRGGEAEQEKVFLSHRFAYLDIGAVHVDSGWVRLENSGLQAGFHGVIAAQADSAICCTAISH
jgi:hypothetical protein